METIKPTCPLVAVTWLDAHSYEDEIELGEVTHHAMPVTTYGLMLRDDEHGVSLASEQTSGKTYRGHTFIPRSLIERVQLIRRNGRTMPRVQQ